MAGGGVQDGSGGSGSALERPKATFFHRLRFVPEPDRSASDGSDGEASSPTYPSPSAVSAPATSLSLCTRWLEDEAELGRPETARSKSSGPSEALWRGTLRAPAAGEADWARFGFGDAAGDPLWYERCNGECGAMAGSAGERIDDGESAGGGCGDALGRLNDRLVRPALALDELVEWCELEPGLPRAAGGSLASASMSADGSAGSAPPPPPEEPLRLLLPPGRPPVLGRECALPGGPGPGKWLPDASTGLPSGESGISTSRVMKVVVGRGPGGGWDRKVGVGIASYGVDGRAWVGVRGSSAACLSPLAPWRVVWRCDFGSESVGEAESSGVWSGARRPRLAGASTGGRSGGAGTGPVAQSDSRLAGTPQLLCPGGP